MSDDDLIRRGDALAAIQLGDTVTKLQARIAAIHAVDAEPVCTTCGGTGITYQTERRCACLGPDLSDPIAVHANMLRGTIAKPTVDQIIHLYGREVFQPMIDAAVAKALELEANLEKAMRVIEAIVEDEGYIPKRVDSDYLDLYKTLDESL